MRKISGLAAALLGGRGMALPPLPGRRVGFGIRAVLRGFRAGLTAMLVALGVMSAGWMAVIAVLITAQETPAPGPPSTCRSHSRSSRSGL